MKSLTITFHASHNYGSMLQAFALQQTLNNVMGHNEILNFRTIRQERMMRVLTCRCSLGPILKDLSHLFFYKQFNKRHAIFEEFISKYLRTTAATYRTLKELQDANLNYDLYVAGSDQIWNPRPEDFDWAYYLPFAHGRKISYAASMGPRGILTKYEQERVKDCLKDFYSISVREQGTKEAIGKISADLDVQVNIDPVFLLRAEEWCNKLPVGGNCNGRYIFFYTLFADKEMIDMVKVISKKTGMPVITPYFSNSNDVIAPFKKQLASGPIEFLQLLTNAKLVVTSSFHGTAFSVIFHKHLISLRGLTDNRIGNLLRLLGMEDCAVSQVSDIDRVLTKNETNWLKVDTIIERERQRSISYLKNCIE